MNAVIHPDSDRVGGWSWDEPRYGEHFHRCSFCGSINPADLAVEPPWRPKWADQKYGWPHKFYVDITNRDPERLYVLSTVSRPPLDVGMTPWADLTPDQLVVVERDGCGGHPEGSPPAGVDFTTHRTHFGKFYTIHLADPLVGAEVREIIERRTGIAFTFADGMVTWRVSSYGCVTTSEVVGWLEGDT